MVNVHTDSQNITIHVSGTSTVGAIAGSSTRYYEQLAKEHMEQAGTYATQAGTSATLAGEYLDDTIEVYSSVQAAGTEAVSVISEATSDSLGSISETTTEALETISQATTTALEAATSASASATEAARIAAEVIESAPRVTVTETTTGATITVEDIHGTSSADIDDGFSPTASVEKVGNKATITITDKDGTTTAEIYDGAGGARSFSQLDGSPYDNTNLANALNTKQDNLVSGTNIKTINKGSILESGNIDLDGKYLNKQQVSNCILEDPQNIKLELNNGVLTLKAGSIICMPNGFESDGVTPKFDEIVIQNDLTQTYPSGVYTLSVFVSNSGTQFRIYSHGSDKSGNVEPTVSCSFYNTDENKLYRYNSGTKQHQMSFPIAVITTDGSQISSIKQTFQSIGYMGSTVFVRKGLKVLYPNGRNVDGSLKNAEVITNRVLTGTVDNTTTNNNVVFLNPTNTGLVITEPNLVSYNEIRNITTKLSTGEQYCSPCLVHFKNAEGAISNFRPCTATRVLTTEDVHIVRTYINGTSGYRIWSDGYCEQWCTAMQAVNNIYTVTFLKTFASPPHVSVSPHMNANSTIGYKHLGYSITTTGFSSYTGQATDIISWFACGYLAEGEY